VNKLLAAVDLRKLLSALWMISLLVPAVASAQPFPVNAAGVTNGHWHLNSKDVQATKKMLVAMGGTPSKPGEAETVTFPGVVVRLSLNAPAGPPTGGTVGSVVNHVGFTVLNTPEAIAKWKAAGVTVLPGGQGRTDQAFVETPDGLRIEILENKDQKFPIQSQHIHFNVPESEIPKIQAWYSAWFGAVPGKRGANIAADLPGINLSFSKAMNDMPQVTTKGRVLDHIGFDVKNLEAFTKKFEAAGGKLDRPYTKNAQTNTALAFITDPWGTYIELNERPNMPAATTAAR
jgi:catechol 2,3-dioxygenase-like lactoylglutathione lyase family enzyme/predicted enzyme related to lactoylglutathione lyase